MVGRDGRSKVRGPRIEHKDSVGTWPCLYFGCPWWGLAPPLYLATLSITWATRHTKSQRYTSGRAWVPRSTAPRRKTRFQDLRRQLSGQASLGNGRDPVYLHYDFRSLNVDSSEASISGPKVQCQDKRPWATSGSSRGKLGSPCKATDSQPI